MMMKYSNGGGKNNNQHNIMMKSQQMFVLLVVVVLSSLLITLSEGAFQATSSSTWSVDRTAACIQQQQRSSSPIPSSLLSPSTPPPTTTCRRMSKDDICGEGFIKQTGPDGGEYCVFDYDTVSKKFGTDHEHLVDNPDHYWEGLEAKNMARKKFGLKPLSPEEYVALQVQSQQIADQLVVDAITESFQKFDANSDGVITFEEFKQGLTDILGSRNDDVSEFSLRKVFDVMDTSGDGLLQLDEFVTLDKIRNKLDKAVVKEQQQQQSLSSENNNNNNNIFQSFLTNLKDKTSQLTNNDHPDKCESNLDCNHPEVCCDFGFTIKRCCRSGKMAKDMELEYAMVPVPQGYK